jgi:two-component system CheB/CheR fusion protein
MVALQFVRGDTMSDSDRTIGARAVPSYVVGIGGSAGSLVALESFFGALQAESTMTFIVATHADPRATRILAEIVARFTSLCVRALPEGSAPERLESGVVYVVPADKRVVMRDGRANLCPAAGSLRFAVVDALFRALAGDAGSRAIAIVLSGMRVGGTAGLEAIRRGLGQIFVQEPTSAAHPSMPSSAIAAGLADLVGTPDQIAEAIDALDHRASIRVGTVSLDAVLAVLRTHHGHDFTECKRSTMSRRIERRMSMHRIAAVGSYVALLERDQGEVTRLVADLRIGAR